MSNDEQVSIAQTSDDLLDDFVLDKRELIEECKRFMGTLTGKLEADEVYYIMRAINDPIKSLPNKKDIDESDFTEPYILNSGVFGLYQSQKESIIKDVDNCIARFTDLKFESLHVENIQVSPHSSVETDPSPFSRLRMLCV